MGRKHLLFITLLTALLTPWTMKAQNIEFYDGFENGLGNWYIFTLDDYIFSTGWFTYNMVEFGIANHGGNYSAASFSIDGFGGVHEYQSPLNADNWLITPRVNLGGTLSFYTWANPSYPDRYQVLLSITNKDWGHLNTDDFTVVLRPYDAAEGGWHQVVIELSAYAGQQGYIAIRHLDSGQYYFLVDDFTLTAPAPVGNFFVTDGNWNTSTNWSTGHVPAAGEDVTLQAHCFIPAGYVANAGQVTMGTGGSLTIKDGGQLIHTNQGVVATMEKEITGYGNSTGKDHYYLIASPVAHAYDNGIGQTYPQQVIHLLDNDYDFYQFDCTEVLEWRNYKAGSFSTMLGGMGYLYANSANTTLCFTGTLHPFTDDRANGGSLLSYDASENGFTGFNLVGNMLAANAYIVIANYESGTGSIGLAQDVYYYTMGDGELVAGTGAVAPMQGVMVQASSRSQVALCNTQAPTGSKHALNLNLSQNGKQVDAAYLRFDEGNELNKIQLNPNHTKLFFTKDCEDFAVVNGEAQGEMPVSFKAEHNGTYTLCFGNENVAFSYLHLIDHMTGNDVDLLATPSYRFEAKTTDYASRFKLVFAQGNANDNFAYFSNGTLVINNEGNATMNVYDVTGRLVNTQRVNGSCQVSFYPAPGVYMIQLVNGDNTKTQKIVVK